MNVGFGAHCGKKSRRGTLGKRITKSFRPLFESLRVDVERSEELRAGFAPSDAAASRL